MASETLSLFPSPVSSIPPKSCLRQVPHTRAACSTVSPTLSSKSSPSMGVRGLALQLTPQSGKPVLVEPANASTKHSFFGSPVTSQSIDETELQALNSSPSSETTSKDRRLPRGVRKAPANIKSNESRSINSGSPTVVRSNSGSSTKQRPITPPMPSIFPEYDSSLPLSKQNYFPTETIQRPQPQRRQDSGVYFPATAPSVSSLPMASLSQLQALWNAANGQASSPSLNSDKIRLAMHHDEIEAGSTAKEIRFGSLEGRTLFSVSAADENNELTVRRHHPARTAILPIAQIELTTLREQQTASTIVFAQQAALAALEAAALTDKANSIAQYDPRASSPQAAQLAFDAVGEAKLQETCQLIRIPCKRNRVGQYELRHPRLGVFQISVAGEVDLLKNEKSRLQRNGKVLLHHPYASPIKSSSMPPALLSLDMAAGTLDVDVSAFKQLDSRYIIDSCICAVLAVAVTASEAVEEKETQPYFAAPPATPTEKNTEYSEKKVKESRWRRVARRRKQKKMSQPSKSTEKEKLPRVTRGILYMLGFSFEAVVWLLGLGVKVLSKLIVCTSAIVSKA